ncbi:MAG: HAMP domain-containing sensor histidine kinase, partial [Syntrophales bacterium]|nr:HAMP domain-containing sensor histidine kinase [Syntrophales bacterium]
AAELVETVRQFHQNNRHLFGNCNIQIHNPSGRPFICTINQPLFEMLMMNLLNNGIKYNDSEKPRIDIRFLLQKNKLHIRFEDNGIGIEKGDMKKIFRKFYQAGRRDGLSPTGSGLGLYLVRHIARMHKGKVIAENRQSERGSVFILVLPFHSQKA